MMSPSQLSRSYSLPSRAIVVRWHRTIRSVNSRAIAAVGAVGVPLTVIGEGPLRETLTARHPEVTFRGWMDRAGIAGEIASARALVMPTRYPEPFGLVVAEAPPGTAPTRARFLARNRIVAGLAEGTVVVEGAFRSGALTTAQWTGALHRPVMGVPGPVTSAASAGVNQLVRLGQASLVTNAQEVITDLTTHAYSAAAAQLDESLIPGPVRSAQTHIPGPPAPAAAPRR